MSVDDDPFARADTTDDRIFYAFPRKLVHIEVGAIEALRSWYGSVLPSGGRVLDLMSSWRSHLPDGLGPVTGLGLNAEEMDDNPQLSSFIVHDLNAEPRLPFADDSFDAAVCSVSVQYMVRPTEVFTDLRRVVVSGGPVAMAFSNRCFPTKAVRRWVFGGAAEHLALVREYFESAGFDPVESIEVPSPDDPMYIVWARAL